jgi:hypothetical protein
MIAPVKTGKRLSHGRREFEEVRRLFPYHRPLAGEGGVRLPRVSRTIFFKGEENKHG